MLIVVERLTGGRRSGGTRSESRHKQMTLVIGGEKKKDSKE